MWLIKWIILNIVQELSVFRENWLYQLRSNWGLKHKSYRCWHCNSKEGICCSMCDRRCKMKIYHGEDPRGPYYDFDSPCDCGAELDGVLYPNYNWKALRDYTNLRFPRRVLGQTGNWLKVSWNTLDETMHWSGFGGMQAGPEPTCEHGHSIYAISQGDFCFDCEQ